jgi:transposase
LTELIEVVYGHKISQGSISNFNKELNDKLCGFVEQVKLSLSQTSKVLHSDETGCMASKALYWVHVYSDKTRTLLQGHANRGRQAMNEIGILNNATGVLIHDRWSSYMGYDQLEHSLCNAHLIRQLKGIAENQRVTWAPQIQKMLMRAKEYKSENGLHLKRAQTLQKRYEAILRKQRPYYQEQERLLRLKKPKGRHKRKPDHKLFLALWKYKKEILLFMYKHEVPFDNNQAERDLRMFKVKMKISNHFLTEKWLNVHATIRSFISTAQKKNLDIIKCLQNAHLNSELATKVAV